MDQTRVKSDIVLRWHREIFKRLWQRKSKAQQNPGRPPLADDLVTLIKRIVKENLTWGAERIRAELLKLGIQVSKSTIQIWGNQEPNRSVDGAAAARSNTIW